MICFAMCLIGCTPATIPQPEPERISLETPGHLAEALFYPSGRSSGPGIIMVPPLATELTGWDTFAREAQQQGYACIVLSLREPREGQSLETALRDTLKDIAAARAILSERGADSHNTAVIGAGAGANLALLYAARDPALPAIVLLSPGKVYEGLAINEVAQAYGNRPMLMLVSTGDAYAASTARQLKADAAGACELREYAGAAYGLDILHRSRQANEQILLWLRQVIGASL